jgi:hypothetical protein
MIVTHVVWGQTQPSQRMTIPICPAIQVIYLVVEPDLCDSCQVQQACKCRESGYERRGRLEKTFTSQSRVLNFDCITVSDKPRLVCNKIIPIKQIHLVVFHWIFGPRLTTYRPIDLTNHRSLNDNSTHHAVAHACNVTNHSNNETSAHTNVSSRPLRFRLMNWMIGIHRTATMP